MKNFGSESINEIVIPNENIDPLMFTIFNRNGACYIVDKSENFPTRIKVEHNKRYRLLFDDYISLGLDIDLKVIECTSKNLGDIDSDNMINIRWVPEKGLSP